MRKSLEFFGVVALAISAESRFRSRKYVTGNCIEHCCFAAFLG